MSVGLQLGLAVALVVGGEQAPLVILVGEGLDDADAADILLHAGVEVADVAEERLPVPRHAPAVAARQPGRERHHECVIKASCILIVNIRTKAPISVITAMKRSSGP